MPANSKKRCRTTSPSIRILRSSIDEICSFENGEDDDQHHHQQQYRHQEGTALAPPPTPSTSSSSFRRILIGTLGMCVPSLLLSSWQSTHKWRKTQTTTAFVQQELDGNSNHTSATATQLQQHLLHEDKFHFCRQGRVKSSASRRNHDNQTSGYVNNNDDADDADAESLTLLYQCAGPLYEEFASLLQSFAQNQSRTVDTGALDIATLQSTRLQHRRSTEKKQCAATLSASLPIHSQWGKRQFPLPDNFTVLVLGNSHLRQISKTLACQYASSSLASIRFLPTLSSVLVDPTEVSQYPHNSDGFVLEFDNGSRWISITNTVLAYSIHWKRLLEEFFLSSLPTSRLEDVDAVVLGKFTTHDEAKHTNFALTMAAEQGMYNAFRRWQEQLPSTRDGDSFLSKEYRTASDDTKADQNRLVVDFESVPPPDLVDLAGVYDGPILSVSMFSKKDEERSLQSYQLYWEECELGPRGTNQDVFLVDGRRYINQLHRECGSDAKTDVGTCHEPTNKTVAPGLKDENKSSHGFGRWQRDPSDMHRCAGKGGGHADLIAWDVVEGLHWMQNKGS